MNTAPVVVVGAGVGGLAAAIRLARSGVSVRVLEARTEAGGLASGLTAGGVSFDGGPYVLLDRPGLEWAFESLGLALADEARLLRVDDVYEVRSRDGTSVRFFADLGRTVDGFESRWPGSGAAYRALVARGAAAHRALEPALHVSRPGIRELLHGGAWRHVPMLLRPLGVELRRSGLPTAVQDAIAIWTHVAGQRTNEAPGFMAMLPALIHGAGPSWVDGGMAVIPGILERVARSLGVAVDYGTAVEAISTHGNRVDGVVTAGGFVPASAVLSNTGVGTYLRLLQPAPPEAQRRLASLPLQSPGVCAYLAIEGDVRGPYMRFDVPGGETRCRLFVTPAALTHGEGPSAARLIVPMDHALAESGGRAGQDAYLDDALAETWWREPLRSVRVVARRVPADWGREFHLHRDAMNPVMTAKFARQGRLAHRSPWVRGLYLAGASTHPGQWVSFCAISGVLAADLVRADLRADR